MCLSSCIARHHVDAIDRARRQAAFAARAVIGDDGMHHVRDTENGVDGAGGLAEVTADTHRLIYACDPIEARLAEFTWDGPRVGAKQVGELSDGLAASRRAEIDRYGVANERLGIWAAAWVATLSTLNTRQHLLNARNRRIVIRHEAALAQQ